jgi:hypothetical protein
MRSKRLELASISMSDRARAGTEKVAGGRTLLGAVLKVMPAILDISSATFTSKPFFVFKP